jgi:hypothetical protein
MQRRLISLSLCTLLFACCRAGAGGCTTVTPPARPSDPVAVYLCDYGIHSSLLLPAGDGRRFVEYAWGDWGYSAKNSAWPQDAFGALFLSGSSAFGRRFVDAQEGGRPPAVLHNGPDQTARVFAIEAPRERVAALVRELDARYAEGARAGRTIYNPVNQVTYVPDRRHYSIFNNCNHFTNSCLQQLGCQIGGFTAHANYAVNQPTARESAQSERPRTPAPSYPARPTTRPSTLTASKPGGERAAPAGSRLAGSPTRPQRAGLDLQ